MDSFQKSEQTPTAISRNSYQWEAPQTLQERISSIFSWFALGVIKSSAAGEWDLNRLEVEGGRTIDANIIQSSIPNNFVIASLIQSRAITNNGGKTMAIMPGILTFMLRFSKAIVDHGV